MPVGQPAERQLRSAIEADPTLVKDAMIRNIETSAVWQTIQRDLPEDGRQVRELRGGLAATSRARVDPPVEELTVIAKGKP